MLRVEQRMDVGNYMESVGFEYVNGKRIFCAFSDATGGKQKLVIMSHGFRGTSIGPARQFVDFQRVLNGEGFAVLRFDQPCSGNSEGDYLESSFSEWIETIVHFAAKYLDAGYAVSLLGQSMGATAAVAAANHPLLRGRIPCLLLWVPDPKDSFALNKEAVLEEDGQRYLASFWKEAQEAGFFHCLAEYDGKIHLVYGDTDRYVEEQAMQRTIELVRKKGQQVMILPGQDHSPWEYDAALEVFRAEIAMLLAAYADA